MPEHERLDRSPTTGREALNLLKAREQARADDYADVEGDAADSIRADTRARIADVDRSIARSRGRRSIHARSRAEAHRMAPRSRESHRDRPSRRRAASSSRTSSSDPGEPAPSDEPALAPVPTAGVTR